MAKLRETARFIPLEVNESTKKCDSLSLTLSLPSFSRDDEKLVRGGKSPGEMFMLAGVIGTVISRVNVCDLFAMRHHLNRALG